MEKDSELKSKSIDEIASTHLGKKSLGSEFYDKSLLVAVPRIDNRVAYDIDDKNLPFYGFDTWNAYEVSFMTASGVPVNRVLKINYSCTSPFIVESKSLKLYLNSFNMTPLKDTIQESIDFFLATVKRDLSELLKTEVNLALHTKLTGHSSMFNGYQSIADIIDLDKLHCESFKENPAVLKLEDKSQTINLHIDCLRSNCRVTHQPDFGDLFLHIKSNKSVNLESLFQYIVSFRKEYHFHEECVEMIYKRLFDLLAPEELCVTALYTRRGGIDICPSRANLPSLLPEELKDVTIYTRTTVKQ